MVLTTTHAGANQDTRRSASASMCPSFERATRIFVILSISVYTIRKASALVKGTDVFGQLLQHSHRLARLSNVLPRVAMSASHSLRVLCLHHVRPWWLATVIVQDDAVMLHFLSHLF